MANAPRVTYDLLEQINDVANEISNILNTKDKDRYFEGIVVLYSFIEDVLTWLLFIQIVWNKLEKETALPDGELDELKNYCNMLDFRSILKLSLTVHLLDYTLYKKIDNARIERNRIIHEYWLYTHKGKKHIFRKKLEKLARIANSLVEKLGYLVEQTGMDESYGIFKIQSGRKLIP